MSPIENEVRRLPLLTKSRLAAARSCQRLHDIKYLQGYRPVDEAAPLRFGTLVHEGLEQIWTGRELSFPGGADPFDLARARPMLMGYQARWDLGLYEVIAVEERFEVDLVNPRTGAPSKTWRLAGKFDVLVREVATGKVYVVEHKTSSEDISRGSAYWARLRMDTQVSVYFAGARAIGHDVAGVLYDVLGKPQLRPYQVNTKRRVAETADEFELRVAQAICEEPDRYYQRGVVVRLETEVDDAMLDVWQQAQQMREAERLGRSPRNPDACAKWGRLCPFFGVCSGSDQLTDPSLFVQSDEVHPELAGTAKEEPTHGSSTSSQARCAAPREDVPHGAGQGEAAAPDQGPSLRA